MSVAEARRRIRLAEPARDYQALRPELEAAVLRVLASGEYVLDAEVAALEHRLAERCEVRYAVTTASGTMALVVALKAAGLGPGDEVITTPYTSIATTAAITLVGARIRLADVHPDTLTLDPARVAAAITPRTRAMVPVHLHGVVADMDGLLALGARHNLAVIEDAALALGASYRGRPVGGLASAGIVSFAPTKILGGLGWGGALLTDDPALAGRARQLAGFGTFPEAEDGLEGYNAQMSSVQATVLRVKLGRLDQWLERRRAIARRYDAACDRLGLARLRPCAHTLSAWRAYVFFAPERAAALAALQAAGVEAAPHFVPALHLRPLYRHLGYQRGDFPVAERASDHAICLPLHPQLVDAEVDRVVAALGGLRA